VIDGLAIVTGAAAGTGLAIARRLAAGVVVNVSSSAGNESTPYVSPEYGSAKAGLIRFTTALGDLEGVRVNCIVPNWILTERARARDRDRAACRRAPGARALTGRH